MLYIHIPFCDSKCHYCAFNSYSDQNALKPLYYNALKRDFEGLERKIYDSVFIGGGTPSCMPLSFYEALFTLLASRITSQTEITIEANPNSVTETWLKGVRELGVNRISFGVQSFDDDKLRLLGRSHKGKEAISAVERAKKAGFRNINGDLIYGTIKDTPELLLKDLETLKKLDVSHVSAYALTIEEKTPFFHSPKYKKEDEALEIFFIEAIRDSFKSYEISNFGLPCRHNVGYWKLKPYDGIGAGAVGFDGKRRIYSIRNIAEYLNTPLEKTYESLSKEDVKKERVLLGLRSFIGVDKTVLNSEEERRLDILIQEKKVRCDATRFYSIDFLLADALTLFLLD